MTNRVSSHHAWSQETNLRLKNPRVKRQLGSTSAGWITPLQLHQSRPLALHTQHKLAPKHLLDYTLGERLLLGLTQEQVNPIQG